MEQSQRYIYSLCFTLLATFDFLPNSMYYFNYLYIESYTSKDYKKFNNSIVSDQTIQTRYHLTIFFIIYQLRYIKYA